MIEQMLDLVHRLDQDEETLRRWIEANKKEEWFRDMHTRFSYQMAGVATTLEIRIAMRMAATYLTKQMVGDGNGHSKERVNSAGG